MNTNHNKAVLAAAIAELVALQAPDHAVMGMAVRKLEVVLSDLYGHEIRLVATLPPRSN